MEGGRQGTRHYQPTYGLILGDREEPAGVSQHMTPATIARFEGKARLENAAWMLV